MEKFRKKPVVIDAAQMTQALAEAHILDKEPLPFDLKIRSCTYHQERREVSYWSLYIETLEGRMEVKDRDWIIRGVKGELCPCKPDIFEATYEPAS